MKSRMFVYGCSQSEPTHLVASLGYRLRKKHWTYIVSEKLNAELINYAEAGFTNEQILGSVLKTRREWRDDYVFLGLTEPVRSLAPWKKGVKALHPGTLQDPEATLLSESETNAYADYFLNIKYPYNRNFGKFWLDIFKTIPCSYLFSYGQWDNYSSIFDESGGEILDAHLGPEGNLKLAENMLARRLQRVSF